MSTVHIAVAVHRYSSLRHVHTYFRTFRISERTNKRINTLSKDITQTKQQRPEAAAITLMRVNTRYVNSARGTSSN